jgi:predicted DCC family thiol-disulfide oxidoreductase YuxK
MRRMRPPYSYRDDPAVPQFADDKPIIVFDGYCALCSGSASFVLRHDARAIFRLAPAQSPLGHALYAHYGLDPQDYETMILIQDGVAWLKSEAAIRIAQGLGFPWSLAAACRVVPLGRRDRLYALMARNRMRWFGRRTSCYRPDPRFADRMLT